MQTGDLDDTADSFNWHRSKADCAGLDSNNL